MALSAFSWYQYFMTWKEDSGMRTDPNPLIWFRITKKTGTRKFRKVNNLGLYTRVPVSISCQPELPA
jgi:hypothetical protein